ncbi:cysteine proteinase [Wallemia mellicola]|nr:cysteine proteinase [Wallemia mellicola]TIC55835.1 cysteine proteinase [Wallemia mellicola]
MTKIPVSIKHAGKKLDLDLNTQASGLDFKNDIYAITGVAPERQKVMIKGGILKDDTDMEKLGSTIKPGHLFMVIGAAGPLPSAPTEKVIFMEDLDDKQLSQALKNPVGLTNLGNTCYLNSSIQVLRAIPELQNNLNNSQNNGLSRSLETLFSSLNNSTDAITPTSFLTTLRSNYQQFTERDRFGQFAQQDAEEAWGAILSSLAGTTGMEGKSFVDQYMRGSYVKEMSTPEAPEEEPTYSIEEFTKLGCNISSNTNYLQQGLSEGLDEQIEKYSGTLNRNAQYVQKSRINRLPSYLTVHLVRFYWRADLGKKAKILRKVKFPMEYDASELVSDDLKAKINPVNKKLYSINKDREERRRLRKRIKTRNDLEEKANNSKNNDEMLIDEIKDEQNKIGDAELLSEEVYQAKEKKELDELVDEDLKNDIGSSKSGLYDLVGIVTHKGVNADGGHYIGWVRGDVHKGEEHQDDWYKFDDNKVSKISKEKIAQLEGGGEDSVAYLLLYKAKM